MPSPFLGTVTAEPGMTAAVNDMGRPQSEESLRKHPRMTLQNRAKIFSPFAALRGYDEQLAEEKQRTERVTKRILTEEEMSDLSDKLMQVTKGMTITVRYFVEDTAHPEIPAVGNYVMPTAICMACGRQNSDKTISPLRADTRKARSGSARRGRFCYSRTSLVCSISTGHSASRPECCRYAFGSIRHAIPQPAESSRGTGISLPGIPFCLQKASSSMTAEVV